LLIGSILAGFEVGFLLAAMFGSAPPPVWGWIAGRGWVTSVELAGCESPSVFGRDACQNVSWN
jgi:hypothetical protein